MNYGIRNTGFFMGYSQGVNFSPMGPSVSQGVSFGGFSNMGGNNVNFFGNFSSRVLWPGGGINPPGMNGTQGFMPPMGGHHRPRGPHGYPGSRHIPGHHGPHGHHGPRPWQPPLGGVRPPIFPGGGGGGYRPPLGGMRPPMMPKPPQPFPFPLSGLRAAT